MWSYHKRTNDNAESYSIAHKPILKILSYDSFLLVRSPLEYCHRMNHRFFYFFSSLWWNAAGCQRLVHLVIGFGCFVGDDWSVRKVWALLLRRGSIPACDLKSSQKVLRIEDKASGNYGTIERAKEKYARGFIYSLSLSLSKRIEVSQKPRAETPLKLSVSSLSLSLLATWGASSADLSYLRYPQLAISPTRMKIPQTRNKSRWVLLIESQMGQYAVRTCDRKWAAPNDGNKVKQERQNAEEGSHPQLSSSPNRSS